MAATKKRTTRGVRDAMQKPGNRGVRDAMQKRGSYAKTYRNPLVGRVQAGSLQGDDNLGGMVTGYGGLSRQAVVAAGRQEHSLNKNSRSALRGASVRKSRQPSGRELTRTWNKLSTGKQAAKVIANRRKSVNKKAR